MKATVDELKHQSLWKIMLVKYVLDYFHPCKHACQRQSRVGWSAGWKELGSLAMVFAETRSIVCRLFCRIGKLMRPTSL